MGGGGCLCSCSLLPTAGLYWVLPHCSSALCFWGTSQQIILSQQPSRSLGNEHPPPVRVERMLKADVAAQLKMAGERTLGKQNTGLGRTEWYIVRDTDIFPHPSPFLYLSTQIHKPCQCRYSPCSHHGRCLTSYKPW